jgi:hypothetical protein
MARIASLRRFIEAFDAEIDLFAGLARRRLARDPGYTAIQQIPGDRAGVGGGVRRRDR